MNEREFKFSMSGTEFLAWLSQQETELRRSTLGQDDLIGTGFIRRNEEWYIKQKLPPQAWNYTILSAVTLSGVAVTWAASGETLIVHTRCETAKYGGVYAQLVLLLERLEAERGLSVSRNRRPLPQVKPEIARRAELAMQAKRSNPALSYQGAATRLNHLRDEASKKGQDPGIGDKELTSDDIKYACDKMRGLEGVVKWPLWEKGAKAY
jgi:hypothetical protein